MARKKMLNGVLVDMTAEEETMHDTDIVNRNATVLQRKLSDIRIIRNKKLSETDWLVTSEQITDAQKTWRENLRKIPQDYTTESQYDLLLSRDSEGNLTNAIWSKPWVK